MADGGDNSLLGTALAAFVAAAAAAIWGFIRSLYAAPEQALAAQASAPTRRENELIEEALRLLRDHTHLLARIERDIETIARHQDTNSEIWRGMREAVDEEIRMLEDMRNRMNQIPIIRQRRKGHDG